MSAPWWLYRLIVRYRMWRNTGACLNRRVEVENTLLEYAKNGQWMTPDQCRELAYKLGVPPQ